MIPFLLYLACPKKKVLATFLHKAPPVVNLQHSSTNVDINKTIGKTLSPFRQLWPQWVRDPAGARNRKKTPE